MKTFAIIQDGKVHHIFTPLTQFGIDENPYPATVKVVDITYLEVQQGESYPFVPKPYKNSWEIQNKLWKIITQEKNKLTVLISLTNRCNQSCVYCYNKERKSKNELNYSDLVKIVQHIEHISEVHLEGGECTLLWGDIAKFIQSYGSRFRITVRTNGTTTPDYTLITKQMLGKISVIFSLDGGEQYNDARRGRGSFNKVLKSIERAKDAGVGDIQVCATIDADTAINRAEQVEEFVDFISKKGIDKLTIHIQTGEGSTPEQRERAYEELLKLKCTCRLLVNPFLECPKELRAVHINADGHIMLRCPFINHSFGHYSEFDYLAYCSLINKADQLKINCKTTDFSQINEYINQLGYEVH